MKIKSNPSLLSKIRKFGTFDTNACLQCGSCTVSCDLSTAYASFPRRIMRMVLLGLERLLVSRLEPWLCYYCGDCSTTCPRETEPGEAMMSLRRFLTAQYDWTGISKKIYTSRKWEIGTLISMGILVLLCVLFYHIQVAGLELSDFLNESMGLEHMFNKIQTFTWLVFFIPLLFLTSNAIRMFWLTIKKDSQIKIPFILYIAEFKTFMLHAITQKGFRECKEKIRWLKHGLLVLGCGLMFFILIFFLKWFQTDNLYPIYHPQRWLGYLAAAALIFATVEILISRVKKKEQIHKFSDLSDWTLPVLLLLTAVSGIMVHFFRYLGFSWLTHVTYAIHLAIVVPMLVIEIPFGKWTHMIYRPLAFYFQKVKEKAQEQQQMTGAVSDNAK